MSRILYKERIEEWADTPTTRHVSDYVEVQVRSWTCQGMTPDVVLEARVLESRQLTVDCRWVYPHDDSDARFIRLGILKFDELLAEHPTLSQ